MLKRTAIGFIVTAGFRAADVVGIQAVLGIDPRHKIHYIGSTEDEVYGTPHFPLVPSTTFARCPELDVLVVGELSAESMNDSACLEFIKNRAKKATYVIGVSNGVVALAKCGLLSGREATADKKHTAELRAYGVTPIDENRVVQDGRFFTAGPSTGAIEAGFSVMRLLRGDFLTKLIELNLEYNPKRQYEHTNERRSIEIKEELNVGVMVSPGMYIPDVIGAVDILGAFPNAKLHYIWKREETIKGILGPTIKATTTFSKCPQMDVIIVGAMMPKFCEDEQLLDFLREQEPHAKAIVSVCIGSLVVGSAGLLRGKVATSNFQMTSLRKHCGALPTHKELVSSGKFYSAGPAIGSYEAALMVVRDLYGPDVAQFLEQERLEYSPNPVFGVGSPLLAGKWLNTISKIAFLPSLPIFRRAILSAYNKQKELPVTALS